MTQVRVVVVIMIDELLQEVIAISSASCIVDEVANIPYLINKIHRTTGRIRHDQSECA